MRKDHRSAVVLRAVFRSESGAILFLYHIWAIQTVRLEKGVEKHEEIAEIAVAAACGGAAAGTAPASALGANTTPRVHVTVENTTYTEANAASD